MLLNLFKMNSLAHRIVRGVVCLIVSVAVSLPVAMADQELPLLGENALLNLQKEDELGRGLYQTLKDRGYVIDDPLVSRYLSDIGESLLSSLDVRLRNYRFYLVKDASVNAFATPGGYIGVNVGLISMCRREDELASVLAHEIAHVELMHSMQMLEKASDINLAGMISLLAAILISGSDPELAGAIVYAGAAGGAQSIVNFTRANEYEADRVGIGLLQKSDYDPSAAADFMQLLQSRELSGALSEIEYIRTHPVNSNRIAEIQSRLSKDGDRQEKPRRFDQFRDYLAYLYPQHFTSRKKTPFIQALDLTRNGKFIEAEKSIRKLIKSDPDSIWYSYALADNLLDQRRFEDAEKIYRSLLSLYPDDFAIGVRLSEVLIGQQQYEKALPVLSNLESRHEHQSKLYQLYVNVYDKLGDTALQRLAEADYHWFNDNKKLARKLYQVLLDKGMLNSAEEEKVKLKLKKK